jgi:hypothetical protein
MCNKPKNFTDPHDFFSTAKALGVVHPKPGKFGIPKILLIMGGNAIL